MKHHTVFKFLAVLLCAAALLTTIVGAVGVLSFADIGLYSDTLKNVQNRQMASDMLALAERIAMYYDTQHRNQRAPAPAFLESYFAYYDKANEIREPQDGMWYYELIDYNTNTTVKISSGSQASTDAVLYNEYMVQSKYPVIYDILDETEVLPTEPPEFLPEGIVKPNETEQAVYPEGWYTYKFSQTGAEDQTFILRDEDGPIYKVRLYLLPGAYEQQVAFLWELLDLAYANKYLPMGMLAVGLLVLGAALTYLCIVAGKVGEEVRVVGINRIPLDVYLGVTVAAAWGLGSGYVHLVEDSFSRETAPIIIQGIALTAFAACVLMVGLMYALAAQVKKSNGYWWRHSALYHLALLSRRALVVLWQLIKVTYAAAKRVTRRILDILPYTWQWVLWAAALVAAVVVAVLSRNWWVIGGVAVAVLVSVYYMLHAYKVLLDGARRMSGGDLHTPVDQTQLLGGFAEFATHLNALADVAVVAAQKQMRSERMRAELITNVSHDIKTPLTSIINYVDLLKNTEDPQAAQEYLEVLSRQSGRMKKLIDDLIELSKASTGNMTVDIQTADAVEYLNQALGEFSDKLEKASLTAIFEAPDQAIPMLCDSRLTWRVLSNLMSNAVKYALPGTRLYVDVAAENDQVRISLKNISRQQLNVSSEELMERFVRGDTARNTEGSGLGLNIAKSLMELQKGQLELLIDGDLFKATLVFPQPKDCS